VKPIILLSNPLCRSDLYRDYVQTFKNLEFHGEESYLKITTNRRNTRRTNGMAQHCACAPLLQSDSAKSSYICFFMAKQSVIKEELGGNTTMLEVSKRLAEKWKSLSPTSS
jgi:hypothetical protein